MKLRKALEKATLERTPPPRPGKKPAIPEAPTKQLIDLALSPSPFTPAVQAPPSSLPTASSGTRPVPKGLHPVSPVIPRPKYVTLDFKRSLLP